MTGLRSRSARCSVLPSAAGKRGYGLSRFTRLGLVCAFCTATAVVALSQTFTTIANFDYANGATPYLMTIVQGDDGNLYGTTPVGGANGPYGTVFQVTTAGTLTTLHSFAGYPTEGAFPSAGLVQATDGNFYGTTEEDGANFAGTVFKITPVGTFTSLYNFCSQSGCTDGSQPDGGLIQGRDGNLYGTTALGGANNAGTVFKMTLDGTLTTIYSFCSQTACLDGSGPSAALVQGRDGNFYGTTAVGGGSALCYNGCGTVFKITPRGKLTTLHSFGETDGYLIVAGLIQANDGNFYGTASAGGPNGTNAGTVFKITQMGVLTTLYSFCTQTLCTDGVFPEAPLVQATDGNLYGTTELGGVYTSGTVFKITSAGSFTTLYSFCAQSNCTDGSRSFDGLMQSTNGILFGTAYYGGTDNEGTIFTLDANLKEFVITRPNAAKVGAQILILGTNLKGTTAVSFNGVAAAFTVVSDSEISATVPTGATTGRVKVTMPGHILSSNSVFQVIR